MYPFQVLDLPHDTTDEQVRRRYDELLAQYTPESAPEMFRLIREAYEQLRDERARIRARLFYFDATARSLTEDLPRFLEHRPRPRMSPEELCEFLRKPE